jgi:hypothetical protein
MFTTILDQDYPWIARNESPMFAGPQILLLDLMNSETKHTKSEAQITPQ